MPNLTPQHLAAMIVAAERSFNDLCDIYVYSGYQNPDGQMIDTFPTTISGVECGYYPTRGLTNFKGEIIFPEIDGVMRLSLDQAITTRDEVLVRDTRFEIDGLETGRTVTTLFLKELDI